MASCKCCANFMVLSGWSVRPASTSARHAPFWAAAFFDALHIASSRELAAEFMQRMSPPRSKRERLNDRYGRSQKRPRAAGRPASSSISDGVRRFDVHVPDLRRRLNLASSSLLGLRFPASTFLSLSRHIPLASRTYQALRSSPALRPNPAARDFQPPASHAPSRDASRLPQIATQPRRPRAPQHP